MATDDLIRQTVQRYVDAETTGDREGWLSLFADGATFEDPAGSEVRTGRASLEEFWDQTRKEFPDMDVRLVQGPAVRGNEAAFAVRASVEMNGAPVVVPAIDVAQFDDDGKIRNLRAFWDAHGTQSS